MNILKNNMFWFQTRFYTLNEMDEQIDVKSFHHKI